MKSNTLIDGVDASSNITSAPTDISDYVNYSYQAVFTGSDVAGTFSLQASNDGENFVVITGATDSPTASNSSLLSVQNAGYRFVRFLWVYGSGTGNITVTFVGKGQLPYSTLR